MRRAAYGAVLLVIYALVASSALHSFLQKWRILNSSQHGLQPVLEHAAPRPYAYRVLMPALVNGLHALPPVRWLFGQDVFLDRGVQRYMEPQAVQDWPRPLRVKYVLAGALMFGFLLLALFSLRGLTRAFYGRHPALADAGPVLFALALPLSFRGDGGFIYDFAELGLCFLGLWLLVRGRFWLYLLLLPVILLNKESAVLLIVFSAIILLSRLPRRHAAMHLALQAAVSLAVVLAVRALFAGRPGGAVEFHLWRNLEHWSQPGSYLAFMTTSTFFLPLPKPHNILFAPLLLWLAIHRWKDKPALARRLFVASLALNIPLFIMFCYRDEFRNLFFVFPFYYLMAIGTLLSLYEGGPRAPAPSAAPPADSA